MLEDPSAQVESKVNPVCSIGDIGRMMFQRLAGLWEDGLRGASGCEPVSWGAGGVRMEKLERALNRPLRSEL